MIDLSSPAVTYKISGKASGSAALLQRVIVELLSDYNAYLGRGCRLKQITETAFLGEEERTKADIKSAIATAKANLLAAQDSSVNLRTSEMLTDLKARSIKLDDDNHWNIELVVAARDGTRIGTTIRQ